MRFILLFLLPSVIWAQCYTTDIYDSARGLCYSVSDKYLSWHNASKYCESFGYELVSIHSKEQDDFINNTVMHPSTIGYFLGGYRSSNSSFFQWKDGSSWDYTNWARGEPYYNYVVKMPSGVWETQIDGFFHFCICSTSAGTGGLTTANPSKPACCPSGWTYFEHTKACYQTNFAADWHTAENLCNELGSHLTSIHSYVENAFVGRLTFTHTSATAQNQMTWIGLKFEGGHWKWSDGSSINFIDFAPKEPRNTDSMQCAMLAQDSSEQNWQTMPCDSQMRAFVCKKPIR